MTRICHYWRPYERSHPHARLEITRAMVIRQHLHWVNDLEHLGLTEAQIQRVAEAAAQAIRVDESYDAEAQS